MQSAEFGYIMSALVGAGLIILAFVLISRVARMLRGDREPDGSGSTSSTGVV